MKKILLPLFIVLLFTSACHAKMPDSKHMQHKSAKTPPPVAANHQGYYKHTYKKIGNEYVFYDNMGHKSAALRYEPNGRIIRCDRYGFPIGYYKRNSLGHFIYYDNFGRIIRNYYGRPAIFNIYLGDLFPISIFI